MNAHKAKLLDGLCTHCRRQSLCSLLKKFTAKYLIHCPDWIWKGVAK